MFNFLFTSCQFYTQGGVLEKNRQTPLILTRLFSQNISNNFLGFDTVEAPSSGYIDTKVDLPLFASLLLLFPLISCQQKLPRTKSRNINDEIVQH